MIPKTPLLLCLLFICGATSAYCQSNFTSIGGNATGAGGSVSYTIGAIDFGTATGSNGSIFIGTQQPFEIFIITGMEENDIRFTASVYPNPTSGLLNLVFNHSFDGATYTLMDAMGKHILSQQAEATQSISLNSNGVYFLKVTNGSGAIKTFKIIKH